jgi:putative ABC transport system ATP-binding protein
MTIAVLSEVTKTYTLGKTKVRGVENISLEIQDGSIVCLMGPSGSGKTTVMNLIGTIDHPDRGTITIFDKDVSQLSDNELSEFRNNYIGFIFQTFNLIPVLTAYENVEYPLLLLKLRKKERKKRIDEMFDVVGLTDFKKHKPEELSGGQRQRVAIARALVVQPKLVLADEPTANLDHETSDVILKMIDRINKEKKTTFIFSTHDDMVAHYADKIIRLFDGSIVVQN